MWKKKVSEQHSNQLDYQVDDDFKTLLDYVNKLASHKLGYPVSLLTYLGIVSNKSLGIQPGTLANVLLNNVGDPFKDSETSLLEVKKHERKVIGMLGKFYGLKKNDVRGYVTTGGTEGNFAGLWWSKRYLINMLIDKLIAMDDKVKSQMKDEQDQMAALAKISMNEYAARSVALQKIIDAKNSISENKSIIQQLLTPTVFFTKGHTHYSVPKISEILHLNIKAIIPNEDGSMNINDFKKELLIHVGAHPHSPVIVIANIGTTITGAIDDVPGIKKVLDAFQSKLRYTIHMDGALTGFVLPILKPFGEIANYFDAIGVNTLAFSAHKYPGLSQPCGLILAKRDFFEKAFEKSERSIDYVGNILDVTITGSRSGLNVLMLYNALMTMGIDKGNEKLTKMVNENIENAKYLYDKLVKMYGADKVLYPYHFNVIFPRPSPTLAKKYQLMLTGERATICVLTNVTKSLIDKFLKDLAAEKEKIMEKTMTKTEYTIQTLQNEHVKAAVDIFTKSFCDSEPMTKYLGIHYHDYEPFARDVILKAVKEGLSKVIVDKQNRVIGCAIAEDMADPFVPHVAHYPKLQPIFALLDELSKPFTEGKKFVKGKVVHVWIAAVDQAHRGEGLSTEEDMACIENAARKGFDFAYAEFTNEISEKVSHHFKLAKPLNRIEYDDFVWNNNKPFKNLKGVAVAYVATIRPGVNIESLSHCYQVMEKY